MQSKRGKRIIVDEVDAKRIVKAGPSNKGLAQEQERARNILKAIPEDTGVGRKTTFLTVDAGGNRAPSAYNVQQSLSAQGMVSQRARQQHDNGPVNTHPTQAVHAFTDSEKRQVKIADHVEKVAKDSGTNVSTALRMDVMDGLARVRMRANDNHLETFIHEPPSYANPHISGGKVKFAQDHSQLADFDAVEKRTNHNRVNQHATKPPFQRGVSDTPSQEAKEFNRTSLQAQQKFAKSVLNSNK